MSLFGAAAFLVALGIAFHEHTMVKKRIMESRKRSIDARKNGRRSNIFDRDV
jgi:hypothetical protein